MDKKYPNLFIVGAPKSGTTSIYNFLKLNSDVYMCPIKEPHFFSKDIKSACVKKLCQKKFFLSQKERR